MTSRVKFNEAHFPALGKKPTHSKKDDRKAPINQNQTPRDETPENNDTRFLQWTVLAYKKILRNNCHLLNVSATFRPRTLTKFDSSAHEKDDTDHDSSAHEKDDADQAVALVLDKDKVIVVADFGNNCLRKIINNGFVSTIIGGDDPAIFNNP
jgi:hypothetical protein